jgi:hypothetical protein
MARKNKNREEKRWRRQLEKKRQDDVVKDSAATLTCAAETAGDFAYQCTHQQEELDFDLPFLHLALEIWRESPLAPPSLVHTEAAANSKESIHRRVHRGNKCSHVTTST